MCSHMFVWGILIVPQLPYYESVPITFFVVSNTSLSPVPFVNDFLDYHLLTFATLDNKANCWNENYGIYRKATDCF